MGCDTAAQAAAQSLPQMAEKEVFGGTAEIGQKEVKK